MGAQRPGRRHALLDRHDTSGRGHVGDNEGRRAVIAHLLGKSGWASTDVFGCLLRGQQPGLTNPTVKAWANEK
jgi:hypothetical protein